MSHLFLSRGPNKPTTRVDTTQCTWRRCYGRFSSPSGVAFWSNISIFLAQRALIKATLICGPARGAHHASHIVRNSCRSEMRVRLWWAVLFQWSLSLLHCSTRYCDRGCIEIVDNRATGAAVAKRQTISWHQRRMVVRHATIRHVKYQVSFTVAVSYN